MPQTLKDFSESLASAAEARGSSVVRIEGARRAPASGIVWSEDMVVTAHHVLEREEGVSVGLSDGSRAEAVLAGRDPTTDLALLRIAGGRLTVPAWGETGGLRAGSLIVSLSRPGRSVRVGLGVLSAAGGDFRAPSGGRLDRYLETDLARGPGFSGSLVLDASGGAAGLASSGLIRGVSLIVPAETVRRVAESLARRGGVRRGYLGIGTWSVPLPRRFAEELGQRSGLLVLSVSAGSPAEKAGLLFGDALVSLGGDPVASARDLLSRLDEESVGTAQPLRVLRAGELREIAIVVGAREAGATASP
jgi:S1-C subfamily serine protease